MVDKKDNTPETENILDNIRSLVQESHEYITVTEYLLMMKRTGQPESLIYDIEDILIQGINTASFDKYQLREAIFHILKHTDISELPENIVIAAAKRLSTKSIMDAKPKLDLLICLTKIPKISETMRKEIDSVVVSALEYHAKRGDYEQVFALEEISNISHVIKAAVEPAFITGLQNCTQCGGYDNTKSKRMEFLVELYLRPNIQDRPKMKKALEDAIYTLFDWEYCEKNITCHDYDGLPPFIKLLKAEGAVLIPERILLRVMGILPNRIRINPTTTNLKYAAEFIFRDDIHKFPENVVVEAIRICGLNAELDRWKKPTLNYSAAVAKMLDNGFKKLPAKAKLMTIQVCGEHGHINPLLAAYKKYSKDNDMTNAILKALMNAVNAHAMAGSTAPTNLYADSGCPDAVRKVLDETVATMIAVLEQKSNLEKLASLYDVPEVVGNKNLKEMLDIAIAKVIESHRTANYYYDLGKLLLCKPDIGNIPHDIVHKAIDICTETNKFDALVDFFVRPDITTEHKKAAEAGLERMLANRTRKTIDGRLIERLLEREDAGLFPDAILINALRALYNEEASWEAMTQEKKGNVDKLLRSMSGINPERLMDMRARATSDSRILSIVKCLRYDDSKILKAPKGTETKPSMQPLKRNII